jgi:chorismate mutase/prephenate dehydratase
VSFFKVLGTYPVAAGAEAAGAREPETVRPREETASDAASSAIASTSTSTSTSGKGYRLASLAHRREPTRVRVGNLLIGGGGFVIMAGPCSVESREQIFAAARAVRDAGGHILRGGCFKPRTSPYSFQGLGYDGLSLLAEAGRAFGLPIVTEVLAEVDVARVAREADMLQIGARNMQNFALLREVGKVDRPVLLKRGMMSSIEELLAAAEYILSQGNQQVVLCERGIRTFETATRNTLDISAVPVLREKTHLPAIVDPSHGCGKSSLVAPLARAAAAAGADGIMVEVHPDPATALSDADQAITPEVFADLVRSVSRFAR